MQAHRITRWLFHPIVQLVVFGSLTWLAYWHLATTYPLDVYTAKYTLTDFGRANDWRSSVIIDFILSTFGALLCCLLAWLVVLRHPHDQRLFWVILGFAVVFAFTLVLMYPITATDIFEYIFHSRILVRYGQNPLVVAPIAFKGDAFLKPIPWALHPAPYGPLWVLLTVPGTIIAGNDFMLNLYMMKGLAVPFFLGSILLIARILRQIDPAYKLAGTLLFAWNPLVLFECPGNGHNGILMMFFALLAIYLLVHRKWIWVIPVLVASVLIKWITAILLLPFLIYCWRAQANAQERWRYLAKTTLLSVGVVIWTALPFLAIPKGLLEEANFFSLIALPSVIYHFLKPIYGNNPAKAITVGTSVLAFIGVYIIALRRWCCRQSPRPLILLSTLLIGAYLGIANLHFQPWFVLWPIALGIWINHRIVRPVLIVFTASALFSYVANFWWIWNYKKWALLQVNLIFVAVVFIPPLLIGMVSSFPVWRQSCLRWFSRPVASDEPII